MSDTFLNAVLLELGLPTEAKGTTKLRNVTKERLLELMNGSNMDVLGAIYVFLRKGLGKSVQPPMTFSEYHYFVLRYYECCLRENPRSHWADSRYSAGWDLVNWFGEVWRDKARRSAAHDIKELLARLYKEGDQELRTCIVTATLEHLFERKAFKKYFDDWHRDSLLKIAYEQASEWANGSRQAPLRKKRRNG